MPQDKAFQKHEDAFAGILYLICEFSVRVGSKEGRSYLRQHFLCHHVEPSLEGVVHFNFALLRVKLDSSSTETKLFLEGCFKGRMSYELTSLVAGSFQCPI